MHGKVSTIAGLFLATLLLAKSQAAEKTAVSLKHAAPTDVHMAVYASHNAERDYQREYIADAWQTFRDEHIGERLMKIVTSRAPKEKLEKAEAAWDEVKGALEPIDLEALCNAEEVLFAQKMAGPFHQNLVVARLTAEGAEGFEKGVVQLFELVEERSDGKATVETAESDEDGDDSTTTLVFGEKEVPFQPCVARLDDVIFLCTSTELLAASLEQFQDESAKSKFDDPRVKEALKHLPKPEDSLTVFDAKQLFESLGGIGDFIREKSDNDEDAERAAKLIDRIIEEVSVVDYEVCVEYTEDGQNRSAAMGKLAPDYDEKLLGRALTSGEPFEEWHSWVPAEATSYSLGTGINLHILYEGIMEIVREEFPESHKALDKFEEKQEEIGVHIDKDIFQSFSGESVCMTLALENSEGSESQQSVTAMKCENPERIEELLERAVEGLQKIPAVQSQQLELVDCEDLEGFKEVHAMFFQMVGVKPVIGFHDGWMILASHREAAEKLLAVRSGDAKSIDRAESLKQFDLDETEGSTYAVSYRDVGAEIRQVAEMIDKAGTMLPVFLMAAHQADPEDMKPVQEIIALLPSVAKVIRKFDFFEHRLSVTHEGPMPDTYVRESVTLIRQQEGK